MQVTFEAVKRPDAIVRLTPEESDLLALFFGALNSSAVHKVLDDAGEDEKKANAINNLIYDIYDALVSEEDE